MTKNPLQLATKTWVLADQLAKNERDYPLWENKQ